MLKISHVSKSYGETLVLDDIDFEIASNSFVAFLGPSGCGKTTLLRMIAGLIDLSGGQIILGEKRIDNIKPSLRDVAMVFQSYALYPHMSVYDNMAFGLKNLKVAQQEIDERIKNAMRILEIGHLSEKKPGQLSGGQRQRVAIGRAIVKNPKIFLFDEPLSNLDASLRVRTRIELAQLHKRMNAIMVMVTHDQIEAMTLADTIVVLNDKKIQQIGSPIDIYTKPKNQFVASFVGSPSINYFDVKIENAGEKISAQINDEISILLDLPFSASQKYENYKLGLRPEFLRHVVSGEYDFKAEVEFVERLGERAIFYVKFGANNKLAIQAEGNAQVPEDGMIGIKIIRAGAILFDDNGLAIYNDESPSS